MKRRFILTISLIFAMINGYAGQIRFYGNGELSCNLISDICLDSSGFIWIGTANGLNRFDGWTFSRYFHKNGDKHSLLSNSVYSLYVDSKKNVWIGTSKGLQCYLPYEDAFRTVAFPQNMQPSVEDVLERKNGEIWIVTGGKGVFAVDGQTMTAIPLEDVNSRCENLFLFSIYEDHSGAVWIPFSNNKILRIKQENGIDASQLYDTPGAIESFTEDQRGNLYMSSSSGINKWDSVSRSLLLLKTFPSRFLKPKILYSHHKGAVYTGFNGQGLHLWEMESTDIRPVGGINSREINIGKIKVEALLEDKDGNLWIGCFRKGLLMIPNKSDLFSFWDFSAAEHLSGHCISSVYRDRQGLFWAGDDNGRLMNLDDNGNVTASYFMQKAVTSIYEDSRHNFWIGTNYGGLARLDKNKKHITLLPALKDEYIKFIIEDNDQNVYFSIFGKGLVQHNLRSDNRRLISNTDDNPAGGLKNNWINIALCDSEGKIWLGHYNGIDYYDPVKDRFYKIKCDSVLLTAVCYSLLEGEKGTVWIGTNDGLYRYRHETGELTHYSADDGLPDNVICGLAKDHAGNIWCSTYKGLCKISIRDGRIYPYSSGGGLFDKEYSRGVYLQYNHHDVYLGGVYGITHFLPDSIPAPEVAKEPVPTHLYLNNRTASPHTLSGGKPVCGTILTETSQLRLSYTDNTFSMDFSTMDYNEPENIRYEYRMAGMDEQWLHTPPGTNRITCNRLPPGKYTLEVRARENGVYSPVKQISVIIVPPWYFSPAAKLFYILLMLLFITVAAYFLYKRMQRRRREEINEEKLKFFINISHEIRSPITLIISPLSMLLKKEYDEATMKALRTMERNAKRIVNLLNQLLDIRRIDKGLMKLTYSHTELVGFIEDVIKGFEYQAEKWNIRMVFESQVKTLPVWIDRNNFDKILVNLLGNAFKFTPENGEIILSLALKKDGRVKGPLRNQVEIRVKDSGTGLDEKKLDKIFERFYQLPAALSSGSGIGLNLCKNLVELHHGVITAENRKDKKGSCFTIRIPAGSTHLQKEELAEPDPLPPPQPSERNSFVEEKDDRKKPSRKSKTKNKVLVIDDNEEICLYLEQELEPSYHVIACHNGREGLQTALDVLPDLILSDIVMPDMDGFTLLKNIKNNSNTSHIPVILLTSRTGPNYRMEGWHKGADAILAKPFSIEELLLLCTNLIAGRARLRGKFTGASDQKEKVRPIDLKSNEEQLMERLMQVINDNIDNPRLNVSLLARETGISRVQLYRKMKEITGIPTGEFIRNIRLTQAAELLKTRKIYASQVAYAVGYSSPSLFSAAFKKHYGTTPTGYAEKESMSSNDPAPEQ